MRSQTIFSQFFIFGSLLVGGIALGLIGFYLWKGWQVAGKIHVENSRVEHATNDDSPLLSGPTSKPLAGEKEGRINILLLGQAGETYPGKHLTDTIILASLDMERKRIGFLSLPRDLYAPIPTTGLSTKLNSLYQYGIGSDKGASFIRQTIEAITGQPVHYFITLDFDGFEKIVDAVGGVRIENTRDIFDTRYPGKNYSYETFELPAGWHTLNGATALKYVRERHSDPEGDFGRAKRQQQVLRALRDRAFSISMFLNPIAINTLFNALGSSVQTDLSLGEIARLAEIVRTIDTQNPASIVVDAWKKESLLRVDHIQVGPVRMFILVPRTGNWNEIRTAADELFEIDARRKRNEIIANEAARVAILAQPEDTHSANAFRRFLMETYHFASVDILIDQSLAVHSTGAIKSANKLEKPYSLDELLKNFELARDDSLDTSFSEKQLRNKEPFDFFVFFGDNLKQTPTANRTLEEEDEAINDPFSEYLEPQKKESGIKK